MSKTGINNFLGWVFAIASLAQILITHDGYMAILWLIVAKLCWIHADIHAGHPERVEA